MADVASGLGCGMHGRLVGEDADVDRRLRAARDGGLVLVVVVVVAIVVGQRESGGTLPTRVTLIEAPTPATERVTFLVRGVGCPAPGDDDARTRVRKRVSTPTVLFDGGEIRVRFRIESPGQSDPCTGPDPGVPYVLTLVTPMGERVLRDANADPPAAFQMEPPR